jgi:hypothetical protein
MANYIGILIYKVYSFGATAPKFVLSGNIRTGGRDNPLLSYYSALLNVILCDSVF